MRLVRSRVFFFPSAFFRGCVGGFSLFFSAFLLCWERIYGNTLGILSNVYGHGLRAMGVLIINGTRHKKGVLYLNFYFSILNDYFAL